MRQIRNATVRKKERNEIRDMGYKIYEKRDEVLSKMAKDVIT